MVLGRAGLAVALLFGGAEAFVPRATFSTRVGLRQYLLGSTPPLKLLACYRYTELHHMRGAGSPWFWTTLSKTSWLPSRAPMTS